MDKEILRANSRLTCCKTEDNSLDPCLTNPFGRGDSKQRKGERKKRVFRESVSNFSLDFPAIGQSNPSEPRNKVAPHDKRYAWISALWSFDNSRR